MDVTVNEDVVALDRVEFETLLAVATLYVESFDPDEMLTLPARMSLQSVENILEKHGKRY